VCNGETRSIDSLRAVLAAHGVRIGELEVLAGWHADGEERDKALVSERAIFRHAEMFGVTRIKTIAPIFPPAEAPPLDVLVERFAAVCDRAAEHGVVLAFEPIAVLPAFNYAMAADVVIAADRPNGGLLFDAWQTFFDPAGLETLERVTARHITGVELCDGRATPGSDLMEECLSHRLLPGEGDFDLFRFIRTLDEKGVDVPLSVEVLNDHLRELSPRETAERSVASVRKLLAAVRAARG
jgi:sugar phosphate isomerase/epimerase